MEQNLEKHNLEAQTNVPRYNEEMKTWVREKLRATSLKELFYVRVILTSNFSNIVK